MLQAVLLESFFDAFGVLLPFSIISFLLLFLFIDLFCVRVCRLPQNISTSPGSSYMPREFLFKPYAAN